MVEQKSLFRIGGSQYISMQIKLKGRTVVSHEDTEGAKAKTPSVGSDQKAGQEITSHKSWALTGTRLVAGDFLTCSLSLANQPLTGRSGLVGQGHMGGCRHGPRKGALWRYGKARKGQEARVVGTRSDVGESQVR